MKPKETTGRIAFFHCHFLGLLTWPLLLFLLFTAAGCSFNRLKKDLKKYDNLVTISGVTTSQTATSAPIRIYILTSDPLQPRLINYEVLKKPGHFSFVIKPGIYRIYAYEDSNRDQHHQNNERTAGSGQIVATKPGSTISNLTIVLPPQADRNLLNELNNIKTKGKTDLVNYKLHTGKIVSLDAPCFAKEFVTMGLWEPLKFIEKVPFGILFMEKYDPDKIPVLFIHGINGSPRFFTEIIANLDRSSFQPWLAYYPSGMKIESIANYFLNLLNELDARQDFKPLQIIAHSMGGLVSRSLINLYNKERNDFQIDRMITISTPFAGHQAAAMGLKYAPAIIPVWNDVAPGNEFLNQLFLKPLPNNLSHYLLFSFEGDSHFTGDSNNDGVVSIASELRPEAQDEAALVHGYAEGHTSILKNRSVSTLINQILSHER